MKRPPYIVAAFSLVEVTLALGVAGFCLLAVFGLLPVGVQTNQRSFSQTAAASILSGVVSDLRATPKTATTSSQFAIIFGTDKTLFFNDAGQSTTQAASRYRLTVTFRNGAVAYPATYADLKVTWPASVNPLATPGNGNNATPPPLPGGSSEIFAAFDRH